MLMFAFSWACHTLDQDGVTESRKIYVHGQVKQNLLHSVIKKQASRN